MALSLGLSRLMLVRRARTKTSGQATAAPPHLQNQMDRNPQMNVLVPSRPRLVCDPSCRSSQLTQVEHPNAWPVDRQPVEGLCQQLTPSSCSHAAALLQHDARVCM